MVAYRFIMVYILVVYILRITTHQLDIHQPALNGIGRHVSWLTGYTIGMV